MIFVDTNVWMHAVGRTHPLRDDARRFLFEGLEQDAELVTSAEVLQELVPAYVRCSVSSPWTQRLHGERRVVSPKKREADSYR